MEIKIIVACHKKNVMATQYPYGLIRVGKDLHLDILPVEVVMKGDSLNGKKDFIKY